MALSHWRRLLGRRRSFEQPPERHPERLRHPPKGSHGRVHAPLLQPLPAFHIDPRRRRRGLLRQSRGNSGITDPPPDLLLHIERRRRFPHRQAATGMTADPQPYYSTVFLAERDPLALTARADP